MDRRPVGAGCLDWRVDRARAVAVVPEMILRSVLLNAVWINLSEVVRHFVFVMPMMRAALPGSAPMDMPVFLIWGVWVTILILAATGFCWLVLDRFGASLRTALAAGTAPRAAIFVTLWPGPTEHEPCYPADPRHRPSARLGRDGGGGTDHPPRHAWLSLAKRGPAGETRRMGDFLDVSASLTGRRWVGPTPEEDRLAEAMVQATALPQPVARILVSRGVAPAEAEAFLEPKLRDLMPDPLTLKDMGTAAERFVQAVRGRERIAIFADYDVDGGASAALLISWLRAIGLKATLYIPDRIDEGYGPNVPAMQALGAEHDLIVCVDCGTLSNEPVAAAGCDVLILDHHLGSETLPPARAVVNPNRQDEDGALGYLCAAGVVFLFLVEVNRQLRAHGAANPELMPLLDLVALATVADVAPLTGLNRAFVRQGLAVMARRGRVGLRALSDVARLDRPPAAYHLGFLLGPRVNAGGRIGAADLGARLLSTEDPHEAAALAERLDKLNDERRAIEAAVLADATAQAEARGTDGPLVWAAGDGWHPGVVGIVASRLKEAFHRPAVVIGFDEAGEGKGSGRSVEGIDLGASVQRLTAEGLLIKGGGHRMAAGLTVARETLEPAMERLGDLLARQGAGAAGPRDLRLDGLLMPGAATPDLVARIETAGPFGAAAPAPRFALPSVLVRHARRVGESHLKLTVEADGARIEAIAFRAYEGPLGPGLEALTGAPVHLAGKLDLNHWQGRVSVELRLDDAAPA